MGKKDFNIIHKVNRNGTYIHFKCKCGTRWAEIHYGSVSYEEDYKNEQNLEHFVKSCKCLIK